MKKFLPLLVAIPTFFFVKYKKKKDSVKEYLSKFNNATKVIKLSCGDLSTIELIFTEDRFTFRQSNFNPDDLRERCRRYDTKILRICDSIEIRNECIFSTTAFLSGDKHRERSVTLDYYDSFSFNVDDIIEDFKTLYDGEKYTIETFK